MRAGIGDAIANLLIIILKPGKTCRIIFFFYMMILKSLKMVL